MTCAGRHSRVDAGLNLPDQVRLHLAGEREPLVHLADAGDRAVHEHQLEVLRVLAAELVEAPEYRADPVERLELVECRVQDGGVVARIQQPEAFFGERVEDVVLAGEVAVDGRRAVFDALGDLANRDVAVAFGHEQLAGRIEDGAADGLAISLLTFFNTHDADLKLNSVQSINIVRRKNVVQGFKTCLNS